MAEDDPLAVFGGPDTARAETERIQSTRGGAARAAAELLPNLHGAPRERRRAHDVGATLDAMSTRRRRKVFRTLHAPLAAVLDDAWIAWRGSPYATGWDRRAYRAPSDPTLSAGARAERIRMLMRIALPYQREPAWFAEWAGHVPAGTFWLGELLAVAVDGGDEAVFSSLERLALGTHQTARFGTHVPVALLASARQDGWEAVVRLLLAAQRQEGLRQSVLEAVDLAHPAAFRRMLDVVLEEGLTRFAATVRAAGVWLGEEFEARDRRLLDELLGRLRGHLDDETARTAALATGGPDDVQLALFATSFHDAVVGGAAAADLLDDPSGDRRLAAARHLADLRLPTAATLLGERVDDQDLRVAAVAVDAIRRGRAHGRATRLLGLLDRLDGDVTVPLGIHRPQESTLSPDRVADLVGRVAGAGEEDLVRRALPRMSPDGRASVARAWGERPRRHRDDLLALTADRSVMVRSRAFEALRDVRLEPSEAPAVEELLRRRSGDVRRGAIGLLVEQPDRAAVASIERLLAGTSAQVAAAVELIALLRDRGRATADVARLATTALADDRVTGADRGVLAPTPGADDAPPPALVVDHPARTPSMPPVGGTLPSHGDEDVARLLSSLDAWLLEHRDVEVTVESWSGTSRELVGNLRHLRRPAPATAAAEVRDHTPLRDLLAPWAERVLGPMSDPGHTAVRAAFAFGAATQVAHADQGGRIRGDTVPGWALDLLRTWAPVDLVDDLRNRHTIASLLPWLVAGHATTTTIAATLADASGTLAAIATHPAATGLPDVATLIAHRRRPWNERSGDMDWRLTEVVGLVGQLDGLREVRPDLDDDTVVAARWRLARWLDEPLGTHDPTTGGRVPYPPVQQYGRQERPGDLPARPARLRAPLPLLLRAHTIGAATDADLDEAMLTEWVEVDLTPRGWVGPWSGRSALGELTRRAPTGTSAAAHAARERAARLRDTLVDVEIGRGELPTSTSGVATQLRAVVGVERACALLAGLGRATFVRGYSWTGGQSRKDVFSRLLRVSFPAADEDHEDLAAAVARHGITDRRLVELAMYAPQWAPDVELVLDWPGLTDAVRWIHAHTKSSDWTVDRDVLAEWRRTTHEQTPLSPADLMAGAVDVEWFRRTRAALGDDRLDRVLAAGKYASSSGGHKRAQLYAASLRGTADEAELVGRIEAKRHKDAVRALGLLPLPHDGDDRESIVLARYEALMAFDRGRRRFGQQRQASEGDAVRIGLDNLARTAGYRDAQRLRWRMEAAAVADLAAGAVELVRDDVTVALSIDADGAPRFDVTRGTRSLKNVPKALTKDEDVAALRARARDLRDQASRMRRELESAAIRGDLFGVDEFRALLGHPVLRPMLARLVVVDGTGALGLPTADGQSLLDVDGDARSLGDRELRIAHPTDLLGSGRWSDWQRRLFAERLRQPFKQVFRELYVPTLGEVDDHRRSARYAGQQVQARQAAALFGARGWVVDFEDGTAVRTFHDEGITALVTTTIAPGTPAEVEDPTIEHVWFVPRDRGGDGAVDRRPIELDAVPARLFSEVMRDVDLVVSVAHSGGVDPEATASTVDVRHAVVRETAELLGLDNVELTDHHAMITGQLGSYSVHLGSGQVHRRPGNAVCIIPVSAQHRGRVFLPFVDDDPRTAEIVSKVVLLADDAGIRDPSILAQLR